MAEEETEEASAAPVCWFCKQPEEECWAEVQMEEIMDELPKDVVNSSNKEKIDYCLGRAEFYCMFQGGRPDGAVPFVDGIVPFCMWEKLFTTFPTHCSKGCMRAPCVFLQHAHDDDCLPWAIDAIDNGFAPNEVRFHLYREYTRLYWGYLGRGNRRELPKCVEKIIKQLFPNTNGEAHVGFQEAPDQV